jgi:hypothetical protein
MEVTLGGGSEAEPTARSVVELVCDAIAVVLGEWGHAGSFGDVVLFQNSA